MKNEDGIKKVRGDRWLKILIIPIMIVIITAITSKQENMGDMIAYSTALVVVFFSIYGGIAIAQEIICLPQKRQIRQMECFASDLQGVLDLIKD